jgi:hypothetical protein
MRRPDFKGIFALAFFNERAAFFGIAAGNGGNDAVAGVQNGFPIFFADVGGA